MCVFFVCVCVCVSVENTEDVLFVHNVTRLFIYFNCWYQFRSRFALILHCFVENLSLSLSLSLCVFLTLCVCLCLCVRACVCGGEWCRLGMQCGLSKVLQWWDFAYCSTSTHSSNISLFLFTLSSVDCLFSTPISRVAGVLQTDSCLRHLDSVVLPVQITQSSVKLY